MVSRVPPPSDGSVPRSSSALAVIVVVGLAVGVWLVNGRDPGTPTGVPAPSASASSSGAPTSSTPRAGLATDAATDAESGLPVVALDDLPVLAQETVALVDAGGPYRCDKDDSTFGNYEGLLPDHRSGYYREYTVTEAGCPYRGALRVVAGDGGELYWTDDHYASFSRVRR